MYKMVLLAANLIRLN